MKEYAKEVVPHDKFYIIKFSKDLNIPYFVFIHGGPGFNCGIMEYLVEKEKIFNKLDYNIVFYDQRGCGRSKNFSGSPSHLENVQDLHDIYLFLIESQNMKIKGFIGHSYGAKLLFDFYNQFKLNIPAIFLATAESMLTPRLNNLLLDLRYLKTRDANRYNAVLEELDNISFEKMWKLTEDLNPLFQENKDRPASYWANMDMFEKVKKIQEEIKLPTNNDTFMGVRKDLYLTLKSFSVDITSLNIPFLWINGLHDYVMNGQDSVFRDSKKVTFFKSAHYPHIEESQKFCEVVNEFSKKM